ncbi:minor tail protein [Gordonia phage Kabocha]|uniref:Uncharacterized protein n=2 Tax=Chidieberevirus TaxID=3044687 RepID=A0A649VL76_9CAUD|nr:hypothetical protein PQD14_gp053 [Gordonia phage Chidiebere]YP_010675696.1 hypothetical protein PQD15_gp049 [Gordonia phage ChisanaKitsune]AZS07907.1 hypothetical protein PBI_GRAY_53 [Gordonia phage Gray]WAA19840.1 minor tail protein [Gordonia phage Kabocha]WAA20030.1 minor tail protein [Gordonia phage Hanem]WNM67073.1 hydrolase [Gordonia Phage Schomber]QGJ92944.1 hypothetical protein PBI_CHIDIEBERE_53 [Gordonia phage Chidiebere]
MTAGGFYGGGHSTKSALDVAYWCQYNVSAFYGTNDLFIPPKSAVDGMYWPYQALQSALQNAGVEIPTEYSDLMAQLRLENLLITPAQAAYTRSALFINQGTLSLSLGDGRRIITEDNYRLSLRYMDANQNYNATFEYGALIPGVQYL